MRLDFPASQYDTYVRDGKWIDDPEFERDLIEDHGGFQHTYGSGWPMVSNSLQVGPKSVNEARQKINEYGGLNGVSVMNDGRIRFESEYSRRSYVKALNKSGHSIGDRN
jgi:hypothetical protein